MFKCFGWFVMWMVLVLVFLQKEIALSLRIQVFEEVSIPVPVPLEMLTCLFGNVPGQPSFQQERELAFFCPENFRAPFSSFILQGF